MASSSKVIMLARRQKMRETMMAPSTNLSLEFFVIHEPCDAAAECFRVGRKIEWHQTLPDVSGQVWELGLHTRADEVMAIRSGSWSRICAKCHELTASAPVTQHPTEKLTNRVLATSRSMEPHSIPSYSYCVTYTLDWILLPPHSPWRRWLKFPSKRWRVSKEDAAKGRKPKFHIRRRPRKPDGEKDFLHFKLCFERFDPVSFLWLWLLIRQCIIFLHNAFSFWQYSLPLSCVLYPEHKSSYIV